MSGWPHSSDGHNRSLRSAKLRQQRIQFIVSVGRGHLFFPLSLKLVSCRILLLCGPFLQLSKEIVAWTLLVQPLVLTDCIVYSSPACACGTQMIGCHGDLISNLPHQNPYTAISSRASSSVMGSGESRIPPESGCRWGSVVTPWQTSVSSVAVMPLTSLCLTAGKTPVLHVGVHSALNVLKWSTIPEGKDVSESNFVQTKAVLINWKCC